MPRSIAHASLLATIALLACSSWLPANRSASAGQGKGGEVIAKPTPTPVPRRGGVLSQVVSADRPRVSVAE